MSCPVCAECQDRNNVTTSLKDRPQIVPRQAEYTLEVELKKVLNKDNITLQHKDAELSVVYDIKGMEQER